MLPPMTGATHQIELIAYPIVFTEDAAFKDTYGGNEGAVLLESYLYRPVGVTSDTVIVFSHPVGGGAYLPMVRSLARAGHHVVFCNSRYKADQALIMEKVVVDLGAAVRTPRSDWGTGGWCSEAGAAVVRCRSSTRSRLATRSTQRPRRVTRPT